MPDASQYKYWLPINATSDNKPIKQISTYISRDSYTGDLAELFTSENGTNSYSARTIPYDVIYDGRYVYTSGTSSLQHKQINDSSTIYVYDITNQENPLTYISNTANALYQVKPKTYSSGITSGVYGCWTAYDGKIYSTYETTSSFKIYDVENQTTTSSVRSPITMAEAGLGMKYLPNENSLLLVSLNGTDTLNITKYNLSTGTSTSLLGSYKLSTSISSTLYHADFIGDDLIAITYSREASPYYKVYTFSISKKVLTDVSFPSITESISTDTGKTLYQIYTFPLNKMLYRFNQARGYVFELTQDESGNGYFNDISSQFGNLLLGIISGCYVTSIYITYLDANEFRAYVRKNALYMEKGINTTAYNIYSDEDYACFYIEGNNTDNYTWNHAVRENISSSDNPLFPTVIDGSPTSYYGVPLYKLYLNPSKEIFILVATTNNECKFIYNQQQVTLKVSVNGEWVNVDSNNIITIGSR